MRTAGGAAALALIVFALAVPDRADAAPEDDWPVQMPPLPPRATRRLEPPRRPMTDDAPYDGVPFVFTDVAASVLFLHARMASARPLFSFPHSFERLELPWSTERWIATGLLAAPGPFVHAIDGRPVNALASFSLRIAPPVWAVAGQFLVGAMGMFVGCLGSSEPGEHIGCGSRGADAGGALGAELGFFGGVAFAVAFDHLSLASHDLTPGHAHVAPSVGSTWAPVLEARPGHVVVGATASF